MSDPSSPTIQNIHGDYSAVAGPGGTATVNIYRPPLIPTAAVAPAPPLHFTGRREQLDALKTALGNGLTPALIAIQGMAGVGKTATAQKLAAEVSPDFPGGIFWGSLSDHDGNCRPILYAWGQTCAQDLSVEQDPKVLADLVRGLLAARREECGPLLVIADDVRLEWLEAAQLLRQALPDGAPFLLTTRDKTVAVALDATVHRLDELLPDEALALLTAYAGVELVEADLEAAEMLLETVGCLPLAIELAGKRLALLARKPGYRLATLGKAVAQRAAEVLILPGHPGLAATFAITYETLPVALQRVFRWLGVFATGPLQVFSVAEVLGLDVVEAEVTLDALVPPALLAWGQVEGTYTLHPLLRQYAQTLLAGTREVDEAGRSHLTYYLAYAQANAQENPAAYDRLEAALPNLLAAVYFAVQVADHQAVSTFGGALYRDSHFLEIRGYMREAVDLLTKSVTACRELGDRGSEGRDLGNLGYVYRYLGQVEKAIKYHEQALAISQEIGDQRDESIQLDNLGTAYHALGQVEKAIEYYQQALTIAREIGDWRREGVSLDHLGIAYWSLGQAERAIGYHEQALAISREIGDRRREGTSAGSLGTAYCLLGEVEQAIEYNEQALAISQEIGDLRGEGKSLGYLGLAYRELGQVEKAIEYLEQALAISRKINDLISVMFWLSALGFAHSDQGQVEQTIRYYQQALAIARKIGDRQNEANVLHSIGELYKDQANVPLARQYLAQSLAIFEEIKSPFAEENRRLLSELEYQVQSPSNSEA